MILKSNGAAFHVIPTKVGTLEEARRSTILVFMLNSCKGIVIQLAGYKEGKQTIHATLDNRKILCDRTQIDSIRMR